MARIDDLEKGLCDSMGVQVVAELRDGKEYGDPVPLAPPVGMTRPMTLSEQIRSMIRREVSLRAQEEGFETFEEAEDFDVDDDFADPHTPYEAVFDPPLKQEVKDGDTVVKQGGPVAGESGPGKPGKEPENKSAAEPKSSDKGSVSQRDAAGEQSAS